MPDHAKNRKTGELGLHDCTLCGTREVLLMSDGRCPNCKQKDSRRGLAKHRLVPAATTTSQDHSETGSGLASSARLFRDVAIVELLVNAGSLSGRMPNGYKASLVSFVGLSLGICIVSTIARKNPLGRAAVILFFVWAIASTFNASAGHHSLEVLAGPIPGMIVFSIPGLAVSFLLRWIRREYNTSFDALTVAKLIRDLAIVESLIAVGTICDRIAYGDEATLGSLAGLALGICIVSTITKRNPLRRAVVILFLVWAMASLIKVAAGYYGLEVLADPLFVMIVFSIPGLAVSFLLRWIRSKYSTTFDTLPVAHGPISSIHNYAQLFHRKAYGYNYDTPLALFVFFCIAPFLDQIINIVHGNGLSFFYLQLWGDSLVEGAILALLLFGLSHTIRDTWFLALLLGVACVAYDIIGEYGWSLVAPHGIVDAFHCHKREVMGPLVLLINTFLWWAFRIVGWSLSIRLWGVRLWSLIIGTCVPSLVTASILRLLAPSVSTSPVWIMCLYGTVLGTLMYFGFYIYFTRSIAPSKGQRATEGLPLSSDDYIGTRTSQHR